MPSIPDNLAAWNDDWGHDGAGWSHAWGTSAAMWRMTIHGRIGRFLPTGSLLEIAPGRGRVTAFLLPHCERYLGIDLSPECVAACRSRFADVGHANFERTDGKSLLAATDDSIDFAFSWDSLVHADGAVVDAYVAELGRVLKPGGFAFVHHSNLAAFAADRDAGPVPNPHWRAADVSADTVRAACERNGLCCRTQELVQWGGAVRHDCFTLLQRPADGSTPPPPTLRFEHPDMNTEMALTRTLDQAYWRL